MQVELITSACSVAFTRDGYFDASEEITSVKRRTRQLVLIWLYRSVQYMVLSKGSVSYSLLNAPDTHIDPTCCSLSEYFSMYPGYSQCWAVTDDYYRKDGQRLDRISVWVGQKWRRSEGPSQHQVCGQWLLYVVVYSECNVLTNLWKHLKQAIFPLLYRGR